MAGGFCLGFVIDFSPYRGYLVLSHSAARILALSSSVLSSFNFFRSLVSRVVVVSLGPAI